MPQTAYRRGGGRHERRGIEVAAEALGAVTLEMEAAKRWEVVSEQDSAVSYVVGLCCPR